MAKQDAEQQLRDKKIQLENERGVVELRMQQQEQEFRLWQRERELEHARKKEADEEMLLKL